jgi:hypothetical protein
MSSDSFNEAVFWVARDAGRQQGLEGRVPSEKQARKLLEEHLERRREQAISRGVTALIEHAKIGKRDREERRRAREVPPVPGIEDKAGIEAARRKRG